MVGVHACAPARGPQGGAERGGGRRGAAGRRRVAHRVGARHDDRAAKGPQCVAYEHHVHRLALVVELGLEAPPHLFDHRHERG